MQVEPEQARCQRSDCMHVAGMVVWGRQKQDAAGGRTKAGEDMHLVHYIVVLG